MMALVIIISTFAINLLSLPFSSWPTFISFPPFPPAAAFSPILYGDTLNGFRKTDSKRFNSNPHGMPQHQLSYPFSVFGSFAP